MTNAQQPIGTAAVFGPGPLAHVVALRLAGALPAARVTLVLTPLAPAALADRFPTTIPANGDWLSAIGSSEQRAVAAGAATHRLGISFEDWGQDRASWTFAHGGDVATGLSVASHQLWLAHGRAITRRFEDLVPGSVMAANERFVLATSDSGPLLTSTDHGLRLDRARLLPLLEAAVRAAGIATLDARTLERVDNGGGTCVQVRLDGGRVVAGDLFVDATGPEALLRVEDAIDASAAQACTHLVIATRHAPPSPRDRVRGLDCGWSGEWPRVEEAVTMIGCDASGVDRAGATLDGSAVEVVELTPRVSRPLMAANVVALGEAAGMLDPLGTFGFALALRHLDLLLELLPARRPDARLIGEINRRSRLITDRVTAFVAALYWARPRNSGPFWQTRHDAAPPGLINTLHHFAERGVLMHVDEESFSPHEWCTALLGLGITPRVTDAIARSVDGSTARAVLSRLATHVAALSSRLPPYPAYLGRLMEAAR